MRLQRSIWSLNWVPIKVLRLMILDWKVLERNSKSIIGFRPEMKQRRTV